MAPSNGKKSALLPPCAGNSPVTGEIPAQWPVTRSFDVLIDLRPNERFCKQSWGGWFETPSHLLWRQFYVHDNSFGYTDSIWGVIWFRIPFTGIEDINQMKTTFFNLLQMSKKYTHHIVPRAKNENMTNMYLEIQFSLYSFILNSALI